MGQGARWPPAGGRSRVLSRSPAGWECPFPQVLACAEMFSGFLGRRSLRSLGSLSCSPSTLPAVPGSGHVCFCLSPAGGSLPAGRWAPAISQVPVPVGGRGGLVCCFSMQLQGPFPHGIRKCLWLSPSPRCFSVPSPSQLGGLAALPSLGPSLGGWRGLLSWAMHLAERSPDFCLEGILRPAAPTPGRQLQLSSAFSLLG